jgi:hypothetical protein
MQEWLDLTQHAFTERNTSQKYLKFSHISPFPVGSLVRRVQPS